MKSVIDVRIGEVSHQSDGRSKVTLSISADRDVLIECRDAFIKSGILAFRNGGESLKIKPDGLASVLVGTGALLLFSSKARLAELIGAV